MPQEQNDKFMELSPVLELVYIMLTNMAKYLDVYATDIDASQLKQYDEAKKALAQTIKTFDGFYGLQSGSSATPLNTNGSGSANEDISVGDDMTDGFAFDNQQASQTPVAPKQQNDQKPYDFASGDDPESLRKAKQAVEELKSLFADMKKKDQSDMQNGERTVSQTPSMVPAPAIGFPSPAPQQNAPIAYPQAPQQTQPMSAPMPTFATPQNIPSQSPVANNQNDSAVMPQAAPVQEPAHVAPAQQDASEIDSILSELRKLQNKGAQQL